MRRSVTFVLTLGTLLAISALLPRDEPFAVTSNANQCVSIRISDNDNTASAIYDTGDASAPWSAWLTTRGGTGPGTITLNGYGPCLATEPPATCTRSGALSLGTLTSGTPGIRGDGPVPAISISAADACTGFTCTGGANEGTTCAADSVCPGALCGPCERIVSFCGVAPFGPH